MSRTRDAGLDRLALQAHLQQVDCDGCGTPAGQPCPRAAAPACWQRFRDADAAHPETAPPTPVTREEPVRRHRVAASERTALDRHRRTCDHCPRPIVIAHIGRDRVPIDADPTPDDTHAAYCLLRLDDRGPVAELLSPGQVVGARLAGQRLHTPHRETCTRGELLKRRTRHHR